MKQHKSHDWNICSGDTTSMMLVHLSHLLLLWALDTPLLRVPELHNITSMPEASLLLCHFELALLIMSLLTVGCSGDYFCLFQSLPSLAAVSLCFFDITLKSDKETKNRSANCLFVLILAPHLHSTIVKPKEHQTWGRGMMQITGPNTKIRLLLHPKPDCFKTRCRKIWYFKKKIIKKTN